MHAMREIFLFQPIRIIFNPDVGRSQNCSVSAVVSQTSLHHETSGGNVKMLSYFLTLKHSEMGEIFIV